MSMEFEDQDEHKVGEEGDHTEMDPTYDSKPTHPKMSPVAAVDGGGRSLALMDDAPLQMRKPRYRECLKNHAVGIGGHAVDGCGEFMAAGEDGSLDALKCAACNCHRNFHRKEADATSALIHYGYHPQSHYQRSPSGYLHHHLAPPPHRPLALPSTSGGGGGYREEMMEDMDMYGGGGGGAGSKKRVRTKFSQEQKEKMYELAERMGWRIQKNDEAAVQQLCNDCGIRRHVFKVWMHNNKHTLSKTTKKP